SSRQICLQLLQLSKPKSAPNICESVIEAEQYHFVVPLAFALAVARVAADSMVAELAHLLGELCVVSRDHAAFAGGQTFDRGKAEDRHVGNAAHSPIAVLRAQSVAGVLNHSQAVPVGNFGDAREVGGT